MLNKLYIAIDLGAGSGRVFLIGFAVAELFFEEIRRFSYPPQFEKGCLRWDFSLIFDEIKKGLKQASERASNLNRIIYSVGVDSWAVDYGLLDADGNLTANPVCYRDARTDGVMEKVFVKVSRDEIYAKTGIQFLNFNTLFQFFSENGALEKVEKFLLLPDLINYFLTEKSFVEYTNATTTQFVNAETKNWDAEIFEKLSLPANLLPEIIHAGTNLGFLKPELAAELNLQNVRVVAPATHDTASAVIGAPLAKNQAYISSGTWSLVGVERGEVLINNDVARENFTNEGGAYQTIRLLKNVTGLWIFESCRREWKERGIETDYEILLRETAAIKVFPGFIFPDDERFLSPPKMLEAVGEQLQETGQPVSENPAVITKIILDSLAFRYASVMRTMENLIGERIESVQIIGGGGRNDYLNQMTANTCNLPVKAGLTEATVTGNALVQAITAGRFANLNEARNYVAQKVRLKEFLPNQTADISAAERRYKQIELAFSDKTVN